MPTAAISPDGAAPATTASAARERHTSRQVIVILGVFALSRALAYAAGLRYDDRLLHGAYQLLDVRLLQRDPVASIGYLQSQPPLFNVVTAMVVRLPHAAVNTTLMIVWHLAGLATALLMYATLVRLGTNRWLAATFTSVFLLLPETMLVESWFFYSEIVMLLVALMLWALARFADTRHTRDGVVFTAALGALILLRSSWHVLLMLVLIAIVWRILRLPTGRLVAVAAVPVLLVVAWSVKNVVVFDSWSNSSWLGMNISYVAHAGVGDHTCRRLEAKGDVSPIACLRAFGKPAVYAGRFHHLPHYGNRAADALFKSTGEPNFNAALYAAVSAQYQRDSVTLLRHGGVGAIGRAELAAYTVWAEPGDDLVQLRTSRKPIAPYADWFDRLVLLRPVARGWNDPARFTADAGAFPIGNALGSISYTLLGLFVLAIYGGISGWRRGASPVRCVCAVGLVVIAYSLVIGNALDYRENNRFRVEGAPVVLVLGAFGADRLGRRWTARRGERTQDAAAPTGTELGTSGPTG